MKPPRLMITPVVTVLLLAPLMALAAGGTKADRSVEHFIREAAAQPANFQRFQGLLREAAEAGKQAALRRRITEIEEAGKAVALPLLGHLARIDGRPEEALRWYRKAAARDGGNRSAMLHLLGRYLVDLGRRSEAIEILEQAMLLSTDRDERSVLFRELVDLTVRARDTVRISSLFARARAGRFQDRKKLLADEAHALTAAGDGDAGASLWRELIRRSRATAELHLLAVRELGALLERRGEVEHALDLYAKALRRLPTAHWMRGEIMDHVVDVHRQAGTLEKLLQRIGRFARGFEADRARARIMEDLGRTDDAIAVWRKMLRRYRYAPEPYEQLMRLLRLQGRLPEVAKLLRAQMRSMPGEVRVVFELARVMGDIGRPREAIRLLGRTSRRFRHDASVLGEITDLLVRLKAPRKVVLGMFKRLRGLEPKEPEHVEVLGAYLYGQHQLSRARQTWAELLQLVHPPARAHLRLARVLRDHHFSAEAEKAYGRALALGPRDPEVLAAVAEWFENARRPEKALGLWQRVLEADPQLLREEGRVAVDHVLDLLSDSGKLRQAVEGWATQVRAVGSPGVARATLLARGLARLGRVDEALRSGRELSERLGGPPVLLRALLAVAREAGRHDDVLEILDVLRKKDPHAALHLLMERAEILLQLGQTAKARVALDAARARAPGDPLLLGKIARLQERLGEVRAAAETLEGAVARHPDQSVLAFRLADLFRRLGQADAERKALERIVRVARKPLDVQRAGRRLIALARTPAHLDALGRILGPVLHRAGDPGAARALWLKVQVRRMRLREVARLLDRSGAEALAAEPRPALGRIVEALGSDDAVAQSRALEVLASDPPPGVEHLVERLIPDPDVEIRLRAVEVLGQRASPEALRVLMRRVLGPAVEGHGDPPTILASVWALGQMPMRNGIPWTRLGRIAQPAGARAGLLLAAGLRRDPGALGLVTAALEEQAALPRAAAYFALARLGPAAPIDLVERALVALSSERGLPLLGARVLALTRGDDRARAAVAGAIVAGRAELIGDLLSLSSQTSGRAGPAGPAGKTRTTAAADLRRLWRRALKPVAAETRFEGFIRASLAQMLAEKLYSGAPPRIDVVGGSLAAALSDAADSRDDGSYERALSRLLPAMDLLSDRLDLDEQRALCRHILSGRPSGGSQGAPSLAAGLPTFGACQELPPASKLGSAFTRAARSGRSAILRRLLAREAPVEPDVVAALRPGTDDAGLAVLWLRLATRSRVQVPVRLVTSWLQPGSRLRNLAVLDNLRATATGPLPAPLLEAFTTVVHEYDVGTRAAVAGVICTRGLPAGLPRPDWLEDLDRDKRTEIESVRKSCARARRTGI